MNTFLELRNKDKTQIEMREVGEGDQEQVEFQNMIYMDNVRSPIQSNKQLSSDI